MATEYAPLIIGNWKMNGSSASATALIRSLQDAGLGAACDIVLCPPFTLLTMVSSLLTDGPMQLGAQDCHDQPSGAFTGNISAAMLKDAGCRYVILGHSERRSYHQESDEMVKNKASAALAAGLIPVICIGESAADRKSAQTLDVLKAQLASSLPANMLPENTVIAYEPLWAIGTGNIPTGEEIAEVHAFIAAYMAEKMPTPFRILYGGSVKPDNAGDILSIPHVGGLLVGGCSLSAEEFGKISDCAAHAASHDHLKKHFPIHLIK